MIVPIKFRDFGYLFESFLWYIRVKVECDNEKRDFVVKNGNMVTEMTEMLKVRKLRIDRAPENDLVFLQKSILDHGVVTPILVDHYGTVVDGVRRVTACIRLGIEDIPAVRVLG